MWNQFFQNVARCNNNTNEGIIRSSGDGELHGVNERDSSKHVVVCDMHKLFITVMTSSSLPRICC